MRMIDADAFDEVLQNAQTECKKNGGNFRYGVLSNVRANLAKMPTVNALINVKDKLPDKTDLYMCLCYDFVTKSYWPELLWHENNRWWKSLETHDNDYTKHVVYWMLIPEQPERSAHREE